MRVVIAVTHAVFCGPAVERIAAAPIDKLLVTDTIPQSAEDIPTLEVVSVAGLLARAIVNIHNSESVSSLFEGELEASKGAECVPTDEQIALGCFNG